MMEESRFVVLADAMLNKIADLVDEILGDEIDVDMQNGILTMSLESGGQYVVNKHAPNRQIWLSSPVSGAAHFDCADDQWVSTRDKDKTLRAVLAAELNEKFGTDLAF